MSSGYTATILPVFVWHGWWPGSYVREGWRVCCTILNYSLLLQHETSMSTHCALASRVESSMLQPPVSITKCTRFCCCGWHWTASTWRHIMSRPAAGIIVTGWTASTVLFRTKTARCVKPPIELSYSLVVWIIFCVADVANPLKMLHPYLTSRFSDVYRGHSECT